ncbi:MAG TPA: extracellular solute-binding protein [Fimbriimonadales bacterium]|jgi:multiple sugar transport system permease protein|nr:extracellular solute-binding protein [Fimbriimonadales bacterium]
MRWLLFFAALICALPGVAADVITVRMIAHPSWGIPPKDAADPGSMARRAIFDEFHRQNPDVRVVNAAGLQVAGNQPDAPFLMSMASDTAPDVFYVNFRQMTNYIEQGFCRPLDDLIARDPDTLQRIKPKIRNVLSSYDGHYYCIPYIQYGMALYYRIDFFREAGLDPSKPPRNWEEFYDYAKKLTVPAKNRYGFLFNNAPEGKAWHWINLLRQAGGEPVAPTPSGAWKCTFNTEAGAIALDFFRKLTLAKWERGGKQIGPAAGLSMRWRDDIDEGKGAMWFDYTNDVLMHVSRTNPALIGVAAMPAGPGGRANEINAGMWAINASITDPKKLDACWRFIKFFIGEKAARVATKSYVENGLGNLVQPELLAKFGYPDLAAQADPLLVEASKEQFENGRPEPYGRNCQMLYVLLDEPIQQALIEPDRPAKEILAAAAKTIDAKLLGFVPPEEMARRRGFALGILIVMVASMVGVAIFGVRQWIKRREPISGGSAKANRFARLALLFLAPAALSLLVWAYYPLFRGLVIAFEDYRIMKPPHYVGLDNFIEVFTQATFWKGLVNSFLFVGLTIAIGFFIPFILALALNEIPRFKVLFRTIFYLPAMTSGLVIAFMWRLFYDKSDTGFLNQVLAPVFGAANWCIDQFNALFHTAIGPFALAHDWLGDPKLAMLAVVIPGIWAGAGPGSILYLAAMKNVPEERYEAADLDGASWFHKVRYIVFPALKPLILINLLGAFIGGFKAMEQIFIMTGGGPLYATHTLGLEVWQNAFMFLKFGYATAAAWVMGAILIGFTILQIRSLLGMKFTASSHA